MEPTLLYCRYIITLFIIFAIIYICYIYNYQTRQTKYVACRTIFVKRNNCVTKLNVSKTGTTPYTKIRVKSK